MSDSAVGPANALGTGTEASRNRQQPEGVAIIGMSCLYPKARDVDAFWSNILGKVNAVTDPPPEAWDADLYYDPDDLATDRTYCKKGGFLADLMEFEPLAFGIPPNTVGGEPDQWLALKAAREALADAGYENLDEATRQRTALILGRGGTFNSGMAIGVQHGLIVSQTLEIIKTLQPNLSDYQMEVLRTGLKAGLPAMGPDLVPGLVPNVIVGRIANRLDLMGPSFTVDAACASSLIAIEQAVGDLLNGSSDLVICGGSQVWTPMPILTLFCQVGALSRRQEIRPFDKDADGTILGEGLGMLVLKRLSDAERDGDRIYAVVRGVGVSSDGRAMGLLTPRLEGEELAIRRAYENAGVSTGSVSLIEAHGTGTPVGDLTEITALRRVFGDRVGDFPTTAIGSVKSMISHTLPAAGAAGMIKTALALHHKVLPPTLNVTEPNPRLELEKTPFYINTEPRPWIQDGEEPRRAAVSAFGFGGVNAHVVLEEYRPTQGVASVPAGDDDSAKLSHLPAWDGEVCVIAAPTREALLERIVSLQAFLPASTPRLQDVAYTLALELGRQAEPGQRLAIVATSIADLSEKLARAAEKLADANTTQIQERAGIYYTSQPLAEDGKLAFIFSGEGSQSHNMLADLCLHFPEVRACFDRLDGARRQHGFKHLPSEFIFPRTSFSPAETAWAEEQLWSMDGAVEAVVTADEALLTILEGLGVKPDAMMGHSAGEWAALRAAGVFGRSRAEKQAWIAQELMTIGDQMAEARDIPSVSLLSIGGSREQVQTLIEPLGNNARVALDNCPHQVVVAVEPSVADALREAAAQEGLIVERLSFDRPFHTPLYSPFSDRLSSALENVSLLAPEIPVYSCATSAPFPPDSAGLHKLMVDQWISPVEFRHTVETLHDEGVRVFVEVGARGNLTAFVEDILRKRPFTAIPSNLQTRSGIAQVNHMAGRLAAHGTTIDLTYLFKYRHVRELDWAAAPAEPARPNVPLNVGFPSMHVSPEMVRDLHLAPAAMTNGHAPAAATVKPAPTPIAATTQPVTPAPPAMQSPVLQPAPSTAVQPVYAASTNGGVSSPAAVPAGPDFAHNFFATMERFLDVERSVMSGYLRGGGQPGNGSFAAPTSPLAPSPVQYQPAPQVSPSTPSPAPGPVVPPVIDTAPVPPPVVQGSMPPLPPVDVSTPVPAARGPIDIQSALLAIVSERTGYPSEAIGLDADLEADLGIDSIKRVEIFGTFQQRLGLSVELESLTSQRSLRRILELLAPGSPPEVTASPAPQASTEAAPPSPAYPMLGDVLTWRPGEALVTRATYDPDGADIYLLDHTIGHHASVYDPSLGGLPIMPLAMSLEVLAEAACTLVPGKVVTAINDIRATRWLAFDGRPQTVEVTARLEPGNPLQVRASLRNLTEDAQGIPITSPVVEATIVLADSFAAPPAMSALALASERKPRLDAQAFYRDVIFHGPMWQGVTSIDATGSNGVKTTLAVLPSDTMLQGNPAPSFVIDPLTLDVAGQALACWTSEHLTSGWLAFPFRVDSIEILEASRPAGEVVPCNVVVTRAGENELCADIEVADSEGRSWMRIWGWTVRRFYLPENLAPVVYLPSGFKDVCEPWPEVLQPLEGSGALECRVLRAQFPNNASFLARAWAMRILSRREREDFALVSPDHNVQSAWLALRQAAKEAVLNLLKREHGLNLLPADVELSQDAAGRWLASGVWQAQMPASPLVAVTQAAGVTLAVAALSADQSLSGLGIDASGEEISDDDRKSGLESGVLAGVMPSEGQTEWRLRMACARRAAAMALGRQQADGGSEITLSSNTDTGLVTVSPQGEGLEDPRLAIATGRYVDLTVAIAISGLPRKIG